MNKKLYAVDSGITNEGSILYQIDPVTMSLSKLGPIDSELSINGLASNGNEIYGWACKSSENEPLLLSIDKTSGKGTVIGSVGHQVLQALGINEAGDMFGVIGSAGTLEFISIDSKTGAQTKIGDLFASIQSVGGLVFDSLGNLYAMMTVKDKNSPNNDGTYLSPVDITTGVFNIGTGMMFTDNIHAKNINCMAYLGFSLYGGTSMGEFYNIQAPAKQVSLIGEPNSATDFMLVGMTACS